MSVPGFRCFCALGSILFLGTQIFPDLTEHAGARSKATIEGYTGAVDSLEFDPAGQVLTSVGYNGVPRLWDVLRGGEIGHGRLNEEWALCIAFAPDGKRLAMGGREDLTFWDPTKEDGPESRWLSGVVRNMAYSPDGKSLLTSDHEGHVRLWDMGQLSLAAEIDTHQFGYTRLVFTSAGIGWATLCPDRRVRVWKQGLAEAPTRYLLPGEGYATMAFSRDASLLFAGSRGGYIQSLEMASGEPVRRFDVGAWVTSLAVSSDGQLLAYGVHDGTVAILDLATGKACCSWKEHTFDVSALAFSPDGCMLASGAKDSSIKIWEVPRGTPNPIHVSLR